MAALGTLGEKITHIFTAKEEYIKNAEAFGKTADNTKVFVVQERLDAIELPENINCLFKPFNMQSIMWSIYIKNTRGAIALK